MGPVQVFARTSQRKVKAVVDNVNRRLTRGDKP